MKFTPAVVVLGALLAGCGSDADQGAEDDATAIIDDSGSVDADAPNDASDTVDADADAAEPDSDAATDATTDAADIAEPDSDAAADATTDSSDGTDATPSELVCVIEAPDDGASMAFAAMVTFTGRVEGLETSVRVVWLSDIDGELSAQTIAPEGATTFDTDTLAAGTHEITLSAAEDIAGGRTCVATVLVTITVDANLAPSVSVSLPSTPTVVNPGTVVDFAGLVADDLTAATDLAIAWSSNIDGVLDVAPANALGEVAFATSELSIGAHTITLTATDDAGLYAHSEVQVRVNSAPSAPVVEISPGIPGTVDNLLAEIAEVSTDADGDAVTYAYVWTRDLEETSVNTDTVDASETLRGQTWTVAVTPNDGYATGETATASVEIRNTAPVIRTTVIEPASLSRATTALCVANAFDVDNDALSLTYRWTRNGVATAATGSAIDGADFVRGDVITCIATVTDGTDESAPLESDAVTVVDSPPTTSDVVLTPTPAFETSTLTCTPTSVDPDGDDLGHSIVWYVNGDPSEATGESIDGAWFSRGDIVGCTATAFDGSSDGNTFASNVIEILNSPPAVTVASITPPSPTESSELRCTAFVADADLDGTTYSYAWFVNDSFAGVVDADLDSSWFGRGDSVECVVTPSDGFDEGAAFTSPAVEIGNTSPVTTEVTLGPTPAYETSTLTCTPSATDADGDTISYAYAWYVNSAAIAPTSSTLTGTYFRRGNTVYCRVTPSDGTASGSAMSSLTVTIQNSVPAVPTVSISPDPADTTRPLVCAVSSTDADGDAITYSISWTRNGSAFTGATTVTVPGDSIPSTALVARDVWVCSARASDGTATSAAGTDTRNIPAAITYYGNYNSLGSVSNIATGYLFAVPVTLPSGGLRQLGFLADSTNTATLRMALYTDSGGAPGTLLASTTDFVGATGRAELAPTTNPAVSAGNYWIAWMNTGANARVSYSATGGAGVVYRPWTYATGFPATFGTTSFAPSQRNAFYAGLD